MFDSDLIEKLFGQRPTVLRNTGMLYSNAIAAQAYDMGFEGIMAASNGRMMNNMHVNNVMCAPLIAKTKPLLQNRHMSNDLANRRVDPSWSWYPLTCSTFGTTTLWNGNVMQQEAIKKIYDLETAVKASEDSDMIHVWRKLQSADHFHYMEKSNGFTPYPSPYEAYIYYMNALEDLQVRVKQQAELIHKAHLATMA